VYDGDTINVVTRLNKREDYYEYSIRLMGIDAPEMKPPMTMPNRDLHKQAAVAARDRLAEIIPIDSVVCVEFQKEEKFGRLLGTVHTLKSTWCGCWWKRDIDAGNQLLQEGMVVEYSGGSKSEFTDEQLHRIVGTVAMTGRLYPTIYETLEIP